MSVRCDNYTIQTMLPNDSRIRPSEESTPLPCPSIPILLFNLLNFFDPPFLVHTSDQCDQRLLGVKHRLNIFPPRTLRTTLRTIHKTLLHPICQFPPLLDRSILAHALHVVGEGVADVEESCEEEAGFGVMKDMV